MITLYQLTFILVVLLAVRYSLFRWLVQPLKNTQTDRAQGLYPLVETAINVLIGTMIVLFTLSYFNISLAPIISGGVAIVWIFGRLLDDIIGGFVVLLQNRFDLGDIIQVDNQNGLKGKVVQLGYRGTTIRDSNGKDWQIRNADLYNRVGLIQKAAYDEQPIFEEPTNFDSSEVPILSGLGPGQTPSTSTQTPSTSTQTPSTST